MAEPNTAEEMASRSSEEIVHEILEEATEESVPYYAAMIECYADKIAELATTETLDRLRNRYEEIKMSYKLAEGKPDGANGGGEAFWDGRKRELLQVINLFQEVENE